MSCSFLSCLEYHTSRPPRSVVVIAALLEEHLYEAELEMIGDIPNDLARDAREKQENED